MTNWQYATTGATGAAPGNTVNIPSNAWQPVYYYPYYYPYQQKCDCHCQETVTTLERIITKLIDKLVTAEKAKTGTQTESPVNEKEARK